MDSVKFKSSKFHKSRNLKHKRYLKPQHGQDNKIQSKVAIGRGHVNPQRRSIRVIALSNPKGGEQRMI